MFIRTEEYDYKGHRIIVYHHVEYKTGKPYCYMSYNGKLYGPGEVKEVRDEILSKIR